MTCSTFLTSNILTSVALRQKENGCVYSKERLPWRSEKDENYTWLERLEDSLFATMDEMERPLALFKSWIESLVTRDSKCSGKSHASRYQPTVLDTKHGRNL